MSRGSYLEDAWTVVNAHLGSQLDCSDSPDVNQPYAEACRLLAK